jgi:hypothetical protein
MLAADESKRRLPRRGRKSFASGIALVTLEKTFVAMTDVRFSPLPDFQESAIRMIRLD